MVYVYKVKEKKQKTKWYCVCSRTIRETIPTIYMYFIELFYYCFFLFCFVLFLSHRCFQIAAVLVRMHAGMYMCVLKWSYLIKKKRYCAEQIDTSLKTQIDLFPELLRHLDVSISTSITICCKDLMAIYSHYFKGVYCFWGI